MVTYAELTNMDIARIVGAAETAGTLSGTLSGRGEEVRSAADIPPEMWAGFDADTAMEVILSQAPTLDDASDVFRRSQRALEDLATGINAAKEKLAQAHDLVAGTGVTIEPDGTVTTPVVEDFGQSVDNYALAQQVRDVIDQALRMADDADDTAIAALRESPGANVDPNAIPGPGGDPRAVNDWWKSLGPADRLAYITRHPEQIGGLDGIPAADRDRANRLALESAIDQREERLREIEDTGLVNAPGASDLRSEKAELERELDALNSLNDRIEVPPPSETGLAKEDNRYYLLGLDPQDDGKAIVAVGNPDTADNVVTYVPGLYTELSTVSGEPAHPDSGDIGRVNSMVEDANRLDPGAKTAGIMWLGYDAPDTLLEASGDASADSGSGALRTFQDGLRVTNAEGSHNTIVGHSYGSTVIGHTARDGHLDVDELVTVGSPGVGVDHVSQLNVDPDHVYATRAENDIIGASTDPHEVPITPEGPFFDIPEGNPGDLPKTDTFANHGVDPTSEDFGARTFTSDEGTEWPVSGYSVPAHSEYWDDGNAARDGMAHIITGQGDQIR